MLLKDRCVSVNDLRVNPKAVILDIDEYEMMKQLLDGAAVLYELTESELSPEIRKLADEARKMKSSDFVNYK